MTNEELFRLVESKRNPVVINKGVSTLGLLGLAFVTLKLMGYITWSWIWVLAPFWIPFLFALIIVLAVILLCSIAVSKTNNIEVKVEEPKQETENKEEVKEEPATNKKKTTKKKSDGNTTKTSKEND